MTIGTNIFPQNSGGGGGTNILLNYKGTYNASTNTPTLANGTGTTGDWYYVTVGGTNNPTGQNIAAGEAIAYNGFIWQNIGLIEAGETDDIVVSNDYIIINGKTVQIGQNVTEALGVLQGQVVPVGTIIQNVSTTVNGYLLCNGTSYNRVDYPALFNLLNIMQGTATLTIANPCVITLTNHGITTGQKVYFTTTGALPTGLTANTTYWINVTGVNTFNVATSYANLIAGTYITTTGTQSGVHTIYLTIGNVTNATTFNVPDYQGKVLANVNTNHGIGKFTGAETHTLTINQMPSHSHYVQGYVFNDYDANDIFSNRQGLDTGANQYNTNSVGGGQAHNNMQPTEFIYFHIKF